MSRLVKVIKKKILNIPKIGTIGYHPSDLPKIKVDIQLFGASFFGSQ